MPIYVYETLEEETGLRERFEIHQSMKEAPLKVHPVNGKPVRRVFQPPNLSTRYTPGAFAQKVEKKNLEKNGFTRYERDKLTGRYHKTAGVDQRAPQMIDPKNLA
jgi:hypothetical protein